MKSILFVLALCMTLGATAYAACDGGECLDTAGTTYKCPTSGGPSCANNQSCSCICKTIVGTNGVSYIVATNTCAQKGNPVSFDGMMDPADQEWEFVLDAQSGE